MYEPSPSLLPSEELKFNPRLDRPSAEPPIFDFDDFMENHVTSDLQLEKLYPGDPVKKTMRSDFVVERRLLIEYGGLVRQRDR